MESRVGHPFGLRPGAEEQEMSVILMMKLLSPAFRCLVLEGGM